jgi:hypothetical protein
MCRFGAGPSHELRSRNARVRALARECHVADGCTFAIAPRVRASPNTLARPLLHVRS